MKEQQPLTASQCIFELISQQWKEDGGNDYSFPTFS
jgi:hypothetical protein